MADDEDDVVFDRAGLLDNQVKSHRDIHGRSGKLIRNKSSKTFLLCVAFLGIGMCIAIPGPTLTNLQSKLGVSIEKISFIYFARALGYLVGSVTGGMLFDWLNQQMVIALAMLLTAVTTAAIPFLPKYSLVNCFIGLQGLSMGVVDTGGNALLIYTWGRKTGPYMQALHFFYGLGAFIAPLIAAPFLALPTSPYLSTPNGTFQNCSNITVHNCTSITTTLPVITTTLPLTTTLPPAGSEKRDLRNAEFVLTQELALEKIKDGFNRVKRGKPPVTGTHPGKDPDAKNMKHLEDETKKRTEDNQEIKRDVEKTTVKNEASSPTTTVTTTTVLKINQKVTILQPTLSVPNVTTKTPFNATTSSSVSGKFLDSLKDLNRSEFAYITISAFMVVISLLFWLSCYRDGCTMIAVRSYEAMEMLQKESRSFKIQILALIFCFYFCYKGLEITYGQFIPTFVKTRFDWSEEKGAFVVALFWGMFALTRALSICFAKCIGPTAMLIIDLVIATIALLVMIIGLKTPSNTDLVIWTSSALFGMGLASMLPTGFTWAERYMEITGKTTSVFVVGSALGEMTIPLVTGYFMEKKQEMAMIYVMFACCLVCAIVFIVLQNMASRQGERPSGSQRQASFSAGGSTRDINRMEMEPVRPESTHRKKVTFNIANENVKARTSLKRLFSGEKGD